jgi:hypothetical protein
MKQAVFRIRKFLVSQIRIRIYLYRSGSESGANHQQAKYFRKTLISTALRLLKDLLSLKTDINVPAVRNMQTD